MFDFSCKKKDCLKEKVLELVNLEPKGKILEAGCGQGRISLDLNRLGFSMVACDLDSKRYVQQQGVEFQRVDLNNKLPWNEGNFNGIIALEVLEHLENPQELLRQFNYILHEKGFLIISVPNILNLRSRLRYLFEGCFDYYREPPLDKFSTRGAKELDIHTTIVRYQELEYFLARNGFKIESVKMSLFEPWALVLSIFAFFIFIQHKLKEIRSYFHKDFSYSRINKIMLSKELLFGRHLIIKARKV